MSQQTTFGMFYPRSKKPKKKNRNISYVKLLREEGKLTPEFEMFIHNFSLEDLISVKLEITAQKAAKGKFYGLPLLQNIKPIMENVFMRFAMSMTSSKREAARFLGVPEVLFDKRYKKYNPNTLRRNI